LAELTQSNFRDQLIAASLKLATEVFAEMHQAISAIN